MTLRRIIAGLLIMVTLLAPIPPLANAAAAPRIQDLTIDFGDFQTKAQLTYPAEGNGPFPTVILIAGSGPFDMDATYTNYDTSGKPQVVSAIFADIAKALPEQGIAVLRYNKHFVSGPGQVDPKFFQATSLKIFANDAEKVLATARQNALVDKQRVFLWGWSEGTVVGAEIAARRTTDVAGLIVQGVVGLSWKETITFWFNEVGIPYLKSIQPDGKLDVKALITAAYTGKGGVTARQIATLLFDPSSTPQKPLVSTLLDTNKDGVIDLATELTPEIVSGLVDFTLTPQSIFGFYSPQNAGALPTSSEQAARLTKLPVLILHGANDGNTPARGADAFLKALTDVGNTQVTLKPYAGLGHSLGKSSDVTQDTFAPIEPEPIADAVAWINQQAPKSAGQ